MIDIHVKDYMELFIKELEKQLDSDEKRWGNTWLFKTKKGQEYRMRETILNYFDQFQYANVPVPWLKIIGNCMIAWIRETQPTLFPE